MVPVQHLRSEKCLAFNRLTTDDLDDMMEFVLHEPVMNVVMIYNLKAFGIEQGPSPFNADYVGRRHEGRLVAVGAHYNLGSFFFRSTSIEAMSGMAACVEGMGRLPAYLAGTRSHLDVFLDELGGRAGRPTRIESTYMVLTRDGVVHSPLSRSTSGGATVRPATLDDLDDMVELQGGFEMEAFGKSVVSDEEIRKLLGHQVGQGTAMVVVEGERMVSKAEATAARPHAALIGGVYTVPDARSRGLSTDCVGTLCEGLLEQVAAVGLNVFKKNHSARKVYQKVGFEDVEDWLTVEMA